MNYNALEKIAAEYYHMGNGFPQYAKSSNGTSELIKRNISSNEDHASIYGSHYGDVKPRVATYSVHEPVYDFYKDIVPNIRKRELKADKLPDAERKALDEIKYTRVKRFKKPFLSRLLTEGSGGVTYAPRALSETAYERPLIGVEAGNDENATMAHEFRHDIENRGVRRVGDSMEKLRREYPFDGIDHYGHLSPWLQKYRLEGEMRATNAELQYKVYQSLRDKIGRSPTFQEYLKYIEQMNDRDVIGLRDEPLNGYDQEARGFWRSVLNIPPKGSSGSQRASEIRDLLLNVTRNSYGQEKKPIV